MQLPGLVPVRTVWRDEACYGHGSAIGEQLRNLGDASDILGPCRRSKTKITIQAEANVVPIEAIGGQPLMQQVLLKRRSDGGLAGRRKPGEPYREAFLTSELESFSSGE
jgi:hypothetical protein